MATGQSREMEKQLSERQRAMLATISFGYIPIGLLELIDEDFKLLVREEYVLTYTGTGASQHCHLSDKGKRYIGIAVTA